MKKCWACGPGTHEMSCDPIEAKDDEDFPNRVIVIRIYRCTNPECNNVSTTSISISR